MGNGTSPDLATPDYRTKPKTRLRNPVVNAISLVSKGANLKSFFLFKSATSPIDYDGFQIDENGDVLGTPNDSDFSKVLPLLKGGPKEDLWKAAYCIVAVPGEEDAQRDVWEAPEIQEAAHNYLKKSRLINFEHQDFDSVGDLVQSAIAPCDMKIGGEFIPEGTWYIAIEPHPEMKKMIEEGDITGVSVQGSSRREPFDGLMTDVAKGTSAAQASQTGAGEFASAVPPRPVTQVAPMNAADKDMMEIPEGTEGPGITKLQHILGIEETGIFDEATLAAVSEWMANKGVPGRPTLATVKLILTEGDKSVEAAQAQPAPETTTEAMAPAEKSASQEEEASTEEAVSIWKAKGAIYHYVGDSSKTPLWVREVTKKGVVVEFPAGSEEEAETTDVSLDELVKCDNPDSHYGQLVKDYPSAMRAVQSAPVDPPYNPATDDASFSNFNTDGVGSTPESTGTQPSEVGPDSTPDDLKVVIARALENGNALLGQHLSSAYQINSVQDLQNYTFTQDEIWGMVSRFVLGRQETPPSDSMYMQPARRTDRSVYGEGAGFSVQKSDKLSKASIYDIQTPSNTLPDKDGNLVGSGAIVKLSGGKLAQVSSVDVEAGKLTVRALPITGDHTTQTVDAKSVVVGEVDPANHGGATKFDYKISKSDFKIGDLVEYKGIVGDVTAVGEDTVTMSHATKANKEVSKEVPKADVKPIGKLSKANKPGGSMGGQHPAKYGKLRFIVRSFGKWAGGKQRICVARMRSEHPEVFKGNENAGCAWLKDQWMGTTKWRNGRRGDLGKLLKGDSEFAAAYNEELLKGAEDLFKASTRYPLQDGFVLRELTSDDIDALIEIEKASSSLPWSDNLFKSEVAREGGHKIGVELDGKLVGFGFGAQDNDSWHVMNLAVMPEVRKSGVGSRLLAELVEAGELAGANEHLLAVRASNEAAINMYKSFGFGQIDVSQNYYDDNNEDAVVMSRAAGISPVDSLFVDMCEDMGLDANEILSQMDSADAFELYLDDLLHDTTDEVESQVEEAELTKQFVEIAKSVSTTEDKVSLIRGLIEDNSDSPERVANDKDFNSAMTALQIGLADAVATDDLEKQERDLDLVMSDFTNWLNKFTEAGHSVDLSGTDEKGEASLEKKLTPQLKKRLNMTEPVKLSKRFEKSADETMCKACGAHAMVKGDVEGLCKACKAKGMAKGDGGSLKGATVTSPDGKKWIVLGQNGDNLSLRSGADTATMAVSEVKVTRQPMGKSYTVADILGAPEGEAEKAMPPALAAAAAKRKRLMGGGEHEAPEAAEIPPHTHTVEGDVTGLPVAAEVEEEEESEAPEAPEAPEGMEEMPKSAAPEMPAAAPEAPAPAPQPEGGDNPVARLLALARKRKQQAAAAPEMAKTEEVAKAAPLNVAKLERLRETKDFLESVLNFDSEATAAAVEAEDATGDAEATNTEAPVAEAAVGEEVNNVENTDNVEKDVDASNTEDMEVKMSDSEITMSQVVEAVNGLGDEVDTILTRLEEFSALGSKLDHIGDLAKSLDASERIDSLEQAVERLAETVGLLNSTAEAVEEIAKRLTSLEDQPGSSTAVAVDTNKEVIAKSAPEEPVLFQRAYGSIF